MHMERLELIRCTETSGIPTRHSVLTDCWGMAQRAYIEAATKGSPPTGMTRAIAIVTMPLTGTRLAPGVSERPDALEPLDLDPVGQPHDHRPAIVGFLFPSLPQIAGFRLEPRRQTGRRPASLLQQRQVRFHLGQLVPRLSPASMFQQMTLTLMDRPRLNRALAGFGVFPKSIAVTIATSATKRIAFLFGVWSVSLF